jgi:hypothetical protein
MVLVGTVKGEISLLLAQPAIAGAEKNPPLRVIKTLAPKGGEAAGRHQKDGQEGRSRLSDDTNPAHVPFLRIFFNFLLKKSPEAPAAATVVGM